MKYGECNNEKYVTNFRKYFLNTEIQKVGGGGTKSTCNFKFDPLKHDDQIKTLQMFL